MCPAPLTRRAIIPPISRPALNLRSSQQVWAAVPPPREKPKIPTRARSRFPVSSRIGITSIQMFKSIQEQNVHPGRGVLPVGQRS